MDPYLTLDGFSDSSFLINDGAVATTSLDFLNLDFNASSFNGEISQAIESLSCQEVPKPADKQEKKAAGTSRNRSRRSPGIVSTSKNAARERSRVKSLRSAFQNLQKSLPYVPPNTKLSKLDVLILATTYISHLMKLLGQEDSSEISPHISASNFLYENKIQKISSGKLPSLFQKTCSTPHTLDRTMLQIETRPSSRSWLWESNYLHPVKKWPMRSRLYAGVEEECSLSFCQPFGNTKEISHEAYVTMLPTYVEQHDMLQ